MIKEKNYSAIRNKIFEWFDKNKYDYPWRNTKDLYQILVSEILLQKTIASNVASFYHSFFKKYSDFSKILETDIDEIQKDIKSLGLSNKRAKILKDLSNLILKENRGIIPEEPHVLKKVKGIADYVSNAYLCFGLNKRTFFFDVNIKRFLSRVFETPNTKIRSDFIVKKLDKLLPESDCKHLYWAILDFGNKVCTKNNPKCESCAISNLCNYYLNL